MSIVIEKSAAAAFEEKVRASRDEFYGGLFGKAFFAHLEEAREYFKELLCTFDDSTTLFRAQGSLKQLDRILDDDGSALVRAIIQKAQEEGDGSHLASKGTGTVEEDDSPVPVGSGEEDGGWASRSPKRHVY